MVELYKYQEEGVAHILDVFSQQKGALLADEPGVGKTAQAIGVSNRVCPLSVLVVCPATPKINWQREFAMWDMWGVKPAVLTTKHRAKVSDTRDMIVNYDILHRMPELQDKEFDLIIFDESHYLKNKDAKRSKAALGIARSAKNVILMSGTPMENSPVELWFQMVVLGWTGEDTYEAYTKKHCNRHVRVIHLRNPRTGQVMKRRVIDVKGSSALPELRDYLYLKRKMLRRKKSDVLTELPPKTYQILEIPRTKQWRSSILNDAMPGGGGAKGQIEYFKTLAEVARATGDTKRLVDSIAEARRLDGEEKVGQAITHIKDLLESIDKVIVFAWHTTVIEELLDALEGYGAVGVYGKTGATARQSAVDKFQSDPGTRVFVGNIKAAGTAITLTAAHFVVFVELDWIPGLMEQASDRAHRNGQRKNVTIQYLVFEDSTDALVAHKLIGKQRTLSTVLDQGVTPDGFKPIDPLDIFTQTN